MTINQMYCEKILELLASFELNGEQTTDLKKKISTFYSQIDQKKTFYKLVDLKIDINVFFSNFNAFESNVHLKVFCDLQVFLFQLDDFVMSCAELNKIIEDYITQHAAQKTGWFYQAEELKPIVHDLYHRRDITAKKVIQEFCNQKLVGWGWGLGLELGNSTTLKPNIEAILNGMPESFEEIDKKRAADEASLRNKLFHYNEKLSNELQKTNELNHGLVEKIMAYEDILTHAPIYLPQSQQFHPLVFSQTNHKENSTQHKRYNSH